MNQDPSKPHPYQPSMAAAARTPRRWPWVVGALVLGCGGILAVVALVVASGIFYQLSGDDTPLSAEERELLLEIDDLAEWMEDFTPDASKEKAYKKTYFDQTYALEYEYEAEALYMNYSVNWETTKGDATLVYLPMWDTTRVGLKISGAEVTVVERNEVFQWGEASRFGILRTEDGPVGNLFVTRWRQYVVYFVLTGLYFDQPESVSELLSPHLEMLKNRQQG